MTVATDRLRSLLELVLAASPTLRDALDDPTPEHWHDAREVADSIGVAVWDLEQTREETEDA